MSDDKNDDGLDWLRDTIETGFDVLEENREFVDKLFNAVHGDSYSGRIKHLEPLKQVIQKEDSYEVAIEVKESDQLDVELMEGDGYIVMGIGGEQYRVDVPEDADIYDADASLNNGVLTVDIPRTENGEVDVDVSVVENDKEIDEGGDE